MAFRPTNANKTNGSTKTFDPNRKHPEPKAGMRPARVSLIIDLGVQERPDFEDEKTGETKPQKPVQQVAIFADLVNDVVDYGGNIGTAQYRLLLNKVYSGEMLGVNFTAVPPRDADGNMIEGKAWGFHPQNLLTKISKACEMPEIIESMEIDQLLNKPFMAQVEVKKTESTKHKDADGNAVIFTNVNFKQASPIPMIEDDNGDEAPMKVKPLMAPALCITFDDAKSEDIKYIRPSILKMIKLAKNYAGSKMQEAVEKYEAQKAQEGASDADSKDKQEPVKDSPKPTAEKPAKKAPAKPVAPVEDEDDGEDCPF